MNFAAIIRRRFAGNFFEHAIKMRERLETNLVSDFANAQIRVEQKILRAFDANPRDVFGKVEARALLEHLAEIKCAGVDSFGDLAERQIVSVILFNIFLGAGDHRRLCVVELNDDLVA